MFPTIVHSLSNNIFAGHRGLGKGTDLQDVSPSFNYKCSRPWHSCNWGADLCQIISTDVRGCSPRGKRGRVEAAAPHPKPGTGAAHVRGIFAEASGALLQKTAKGLALETESLLCAF